MKQKLTAILLATSLFINTSCALVTVGSAGTVASGVAVGYYLRGATVRVYDVDVAKAHDAVRQSFRDAQISVIAERQNSETSKISGKTVDGFPVCAVIKKQTDKASSINVRVGRIGNTDLNLQLHDYIKPHIDTLHSNKPLTPNSYDSTVPPAVEDAATATEDEALIFDYAK